MCTIWGYAQGWWTVTGLLLDILGFGILALDVLREYRRYRRARDLEETAEGLEWLRDNPEGKYVDDPESELSAVRRQYDELLRTIHRGNINLMRHVYRDGAIAKLGSFDEQAAAYRLKANEVGSEPIRRAPIVFGVVLVFTGFLLQVVGAIPCN